MGSRAERIRCGDNDGWGSCYLGLSQAVDGGVVVYGLRNVRGVISSGGSYPPCREAIDAGAQVLNSKMAYDIKTDEYNNLTKWKARGVLVGTRQTKGISFDEIFSATVRFSSIRLILAIAAVLAWGLFQFDIKAAYLRAEMDMPVYMKQTGFTFHR